MTRLQTAFLDALDFVVRLRQRQNPVEFFWPNVGEVYDKAHMQAENNATEAELEGKKVAITLVPGAYSRIPVEEPGKLEELVSYKAAVVLDMDGA
jgi:hypothetical protein